MPKRAPSPCTRAATPCRAKSALQPAIQPLGDGVDVLVETRLTIGGHRGQPRGDGDRVAVVGAAVLAIARAASAGP